MLSDGRYSCNSDLIKKDFTISQERFEQDKVLPLLKIECGIQGKLLIKNLFIENLSVETSSLVNFIIKDCNIATLHLSNPEANSPGNIKLSIENTQIGRLSLQPNSISQFEMEGGCILSIDCPPPEAKNPFTGPVSLKNVFLTKRKDGFLDSPQPYRNLRHHLKGLGNIQAANVVHAAELAVEREGDSPMNKLLSHLYECFSNFGTSTFRPLFFLFGLSFLSFLIIAITDGACLSVLGKNSGWYIILAQDDMCGRMTKAFVLSLQPMVNPLGLFSGKTLLVYKSGLLAIWGGLQGLLSAIFITLFIFAMRRRFKLE